MKRSQFSGSSETEALRFIHSTNLNLPIPRLIDSVNVGEQVYTIMTRLPGDTLMNMHRRMDKELTEEFIRNINHDILNVIKQLWTLKPPVEIQKDQIVMYHSSGEGLLTAKMYMEERIGPLHLAELYAHHTPRLAEHRPWTGQDIINLEPERIKKVLADKITYVHCDLRPMNIMVHNGKLSGIIDWHARHWQLFMLRIPFGLANPEKFAKCWKDVRFEEDIERAYQAGWELIQNKV